MVSVPGGSFYNGTTTLTLSPFLMGKYETTWDLWQCVKYWARSRGYEFNDNATNVNIGNGNHEMGCGE